MDGELLAAAMRLKRYTEYLEKQYDTDVLLLADFAVLKILGAHS